MDDSDLLAFTPVPLRARRGGWTAKKQYFFILGLARGFTAGRAAAMLGLTRKTAYELRRKPGGEGFAAAWDAAVARARERRFEAKAASLAERGLHGEWIPRLYRGRLTGWTHRASNIGLTRLLDRLDRMAERLPPGTDMANVDRYLASLRAERDSPDANSPPERGSCHVPKPPRPACGRGLRSGPGRSEPGQDTDPPPAPPASGRKALEPAPPGGGRGAP